MNECLTMSRANFSAEQQMHFQKTKKNEKNDDDDNSNDNEDNAEANLFNIFIKKK